MNDEHKMNADDPSDAIATPAQQDPRPRRPGGTKRWFKVAALLGLGAIGGGIATAR